VDAVKPSTAKNIPEFFLISRDQTPQNPSPTTPYIFTPPLLLFTVASLNKNKKVCRQGLEKPEIVNIFLDKKVTYICCGKLVNKSHNIIPPPPPKKSSE